MDILSSLKPCFDISRSCEWEILRRICCSGVNLPLSASATWWKDSIRSHSTSILSPWATPWLVEPAPAEGPLLAVAGGPDIIGAEKSSWRQVQGLISRRTAHWRLELAARPSNVYSRPDIFLGPCSTGTHHLLTLVSLGRLSLSIYLHPSISVYLSISPSPLPPLTISLSLSWWLARTLTHSRSRAHADKSNEHFMGRLIHRDAGTELKALSDLFARAYCTTRMTRSK
jgi:hypothetical protein